jgi:hypothetical protein
VDKVNDVFTAIDQVAITPAELANPQLELALSLNTAGSDIVTAYYAFGSGNTLGSFTQQLDGVRQHRRKHQHVHH